MKLTSNNCPACGRIADLTQDLDKKYYVGCLECKTRGPGRKTRHNAIAAWNRIFKS
ncbi:unnamed protein product [marine sediment metagenome]|uniref:Restriction alleviation protein, Lar family n=1 Tax=marine sediment metagenome TaxID=412755 RepID=X1BRC5_9ZZZZ